MDKRELGIVCVVALLLLGMGFWIGRSGIWPQVVYRTGETRVTTDTVIRVVHTPPIVIHDAPVHITARRDAEPVLWIDSTAHRADTRSPPDTLGVVRPFTAVMPDTVIGGDTISATFSFPPPRQSILLRPGPDSVITHNITASTEIIREPPFLEKVGYGALGAAVGMGIVLILGRR